MDPGKWMDLLLTRILIIKLLTWLITLVDEEPDSGSKRGLEVDFDFSSFLLLFGCVVCHLANAQRIDQQ